MREKGNEIIFFKKQILCFYQLMRNIDKQTLKKNLVKIVSILFHWFPTIRLPVPVDKKHKTVQFILHLKIMGTIKRKDCFSTIFRLCLLRISLKVIFFKFLENYTFLLYFLLHFFKQKITEKKSSQLRTIDEKKYYTQWPFVSFLDSI